MSSLCSSTGPSALCLTFIHSETDEDFESWAEEPPQFFDDNVWEGDDDACAAESYLEAFVHDLGGKAVFPTLLPGIEQMLRGGEKQRQVELLSFTIKTNSQNLLLLCCYRLEVKEGRPRRVGAPPRGLSRRIFSIQH